MNPIERAVEPLRSQAIARAELDLNERISNVKSELIAHNWDRQLVAPYPSSNMSRNMWHKQSAYWHFVHSFTRSTQVLRRFNEPDYCEIDGQGLLLVQERVKEVAAQQYTEFVAKLNHKIGKVKSAKLVGDHVWSHSILTVETENGEIQHWKTRMIINVSKLGTLFNQWPTRKVKNPV